MARDAWMHPADRRILEYLGEHPPDYVPLVANRLGLNLSHAERRVEVLVDRGLVEPVTEESIYGLTDRGEVLLAAEDAAVGRAGDD